MENKTAENDCENYSESMESCNKSLNEPTVLKQDTIDAILNDTTSSCNTLSSWDSESEISNSDMTYKDSFEGVIYRTHVSEAAISIQFVSGVFFEAFKEKMHADYMNSVDIDSTNFVSRCTTHIKGAKCDIKLDSHFKTVDLSGIGFRIWREERFSVIARSLFKRLMYNLDSQLEALSQCEPKSGDGTVICDQQENLTCGAETTTSDVNVAPMINVAPKGNFALKSNVAPKSNVEPKSHVADSSYATHSRNEDATEVLNLEKKGNVEFTAENITSWYKQGVDIPNAQGLMTGCMENRATPVFTSTPITL